MDPVAERVELKSTVEDDQGVQMKSGLRAAVELAAGLLVIVVAGACATLKVEVPATFTAATPAPPAVAPEPTSTRGPALIPASSPTPPVTPAIDDAAAQLLALINAERARGGLPVLTADAQ